jgi:flotillin
MELALASKLLIGAGVGASGLGVFTFFRYRAVPANQYMAKTGPFVKGVHVSRKTFQLPFQKIKVIKMDPINYHFLGSNMSKELVPFKLPLTFTVSPRHPEIDLPGFIKYATRLGDMDHEGVKTIIAGIVHGETRGFVASMTIPEIFSDKEAFKQHVVDRVQKDLDQFGLEIHNANIEEMHDTDGNSYFENLKKKALEGANTRSRIDVSEARKEGDIGEKK